MKTVKIGLISRRQFALAFIEGESTTTALPTLNEILSDENNAWEWQYALQDNIDAVLDLKVGERLNMNFNRDNADSFGTIKRIK